MSDPNTKMAHSDVPTPVPPGEDPDELLPEYDLRGGVRGKYAARYAEGTNLMPLDPDVAAAFPDHREANAVLRAVARLIRAHLAIPSTESAGDSSGEAVA